MPTRSEDAFPMSGQGSDPSSQGVNTSEATHDRTHTASSDRPSLTGYEILELLAQSGSSDIYRACDKRLGKEVAIKVQRLELTPDAALQLNNTVRMEAQLQHPGVPPVFEVGNLPDGRPYQVMRLIKGEPLSDLLAKRINPIADRIRFLSVFEQICQTIAYVHDQGVIHRDLKPQNVMIGQFGEVQVIGWRMATILRGESSEPPFEVCFPAYMAPECFRGDWKKVDAHADVFALGGILLVILTGQPTYVGESAVDKIQKASAGDLSEAHNRLDRCGEEVELIAIAKRCLDPDPTNRPANAKEVAALISAYRNALNERVRTSEAQRLATESVEIEKGKRRQLQVALVLVVGLFFIWTVAMLWWQSRQATLRRMFEGSHEPEEKQVLKPTEQDRAAAERRVRELQERSLLLQKQKRQQVERDQAAKKKLNLPDVHIAPMPREVKRSGP